MVAVAVRRKHGEQHFRSNKFFLLISVKWYLSAVQHSHKNEKTEESSLYVWGALRDLVPFVQFEKQKIHPRRSVTFSKAAGKLANVSKFWN